MILTWHQFAVFATWTLLVWILIIAGCNELDHKDDPVTDLGEQPINAEGWIWQ